MKGLKEIERVTHEISQMSANDFAKLLVDNDPTIENHIKGEIVMKAEDIKIGMKVKHMVFGFVGEVLSLPLNLGCFALCEVLFDKHDDALIGCSTLTVVNLLEPFDPPEFEWDTEVPTIGEPIQIRVGQWVIKIDDTKRAFFDKPKEVYHNLGRSKLHAIIPDRQLPFVLYDSSARYDVHLPVKHNPQKPKVLKVTMEEVYEKFGREVEIITKDSE